MNTSAEAEKTLPMTVANTGFMLDRMGQDCAPLQYLRELTQNATEAVLATPGKKGEVIWDVDWTTYLHTGGTYKLCVIDNGVGMTGDEMIKYINQLSSSVHQQSHDGNFGVGAKIAAATRNHEGLVYLSWKNGAGAMIQLWRDPSTGVYGLKQFQRPDGTYGHWAPVDDRVKPDAIDKHGTMVVLLGNSIDENTMKPPAGVQSPSRWVGRYLNTRYFRFPRGVTVKAREGWENPRSDTDRNILRTVIGQATYLEQHAEKSGTLELTSARAHWWILKNEPALTQNSGFVASSGHMAALYKNELYEMAVGRGGVARLQLFGVIFGYNRVVIYVEPLSADDFEVTSNTARTQLLANSEPLPWTEWAAEFREHMPTEIKVLMEEVASGAVSSDHKNSIRERLKQIRDLFKVSRYRPLPKGSLLIDPDSVTQGGTPEQQQKPRTRKSTSRGGRSGGRGGNVYTLFMAADGVPGTAVRGEPEPEVRWISTANGTREPDFLADRAAKYLPDVNLLQINGDFRIFTDMVDRWCKQYNNVPSARDVVQEIVREWFEQQLIETVLGVQALKDSKEWSMDAISTAWGEEALTASVMPRYHVDIAIKRALGSKLGTLKERAFGG